MVKMIAKLYILITLLFATCHSRLYFPKGSDVGYIIPDKNVPEHKLQDINHDENVVQKLVERSVNRENSDDEKGWKGIWFPTSATAAMLPSDEPVEEDSSVPPELKDEVHGVKMGISHVKCDNGKIKLEVDWDFSPVNYTCFTPKNHLPVLSDLIPAKKCVHIPWSYRPRHFCMQHKIKYNTTLPVFGPHRPLWPIYGEYTFVPPQRWLHSLEHGAVVMLYHPCAEPILVDKLRSLVTSCIYKHVIGAYNLLTEERPLALLTWGCSLEMSIPDSDLVKKFIKETALHGPEGRLPKQGSYKAGLIQKAQVPVGSTRGDSVLCPDPN